MHPCTQALLAGGPSDAELPAAAAPVLIGTDVGAALLEPSSAAALAAAKRRCVTLKVRASNPWGYRGGSAVAHCGSTVGLEGMFEAGF